MFKRPIFWLASISFIVGILLVNTRVSMLFILLNVSMFLFAMKRVIGTKVLMVSLMIVVALMGRYVQVCERHEEMRLNVESLAGKSLDVVGEIRRHDPFDSEKVDLKILSMVRADDGYREELLSGKTLILKCSDAGESLPYGNVISLQLQVLPIGGAGNPGEFDYLLYAFNEGIVATAYVDAGDLRVLESYEAKGLGSLRYWSDTIRDRVIMSIGERLKGANTKRSHGLAVAMLLGYDTLVDERDLEDYFISSTVHILTVSGFHFAFVHTLLSNGLSIFPLGYRTRFLLSLAFVLFFVWLTGVKFAPVRAAVSMELYLMAPWFRRRFDILTAASVLVLFELMINPLRAADMSLVLTFMACIGIGCLYPSVGGMKGIGWLKERFPKWGINLMDALLISFSCSVATGIIIFQGNNRFNSIAWLSNLLMAYVSGVFMTYQILLAFLGLRSELLGSRFGIVSGFFAAVMGEINGFYGRMPMDALGYRPDFDLFSVLVMGNLFTIYVIAVQVDLRIKMPDLKAIAVMAFVVIVLFTASHFSNPSTELVIFDVGQGDSTMLKSRKDAILIDAGPDTFDLQNQLFENGIIRPETVLLTHGHADHVGGLGSLVIPVTSSDLSDDMVRYDMLRCFLPGNQEYAGSGDDGKDDGRLRAIKLERMIFTDGSDLAGVTLTSFKLEDLSLPSEETQVSYVAENEKEDENENMTVYWISKGSFDALILGDATGQYEKILSRYFKDNQMVCDVLRTSHHGSASSTTDVLLDSVRPPIAIVSVGNNHYGHPSEAVLERLMSRNIKVYETMAEGQLRIRIEEEGFHISNWGKTPFNWRGRVL